MNVVRSNNRRRKKGERNDRNRGRKEVERRGRRE
jgi:hypothetical protein